MSTIYIQEFQSHNLWVSLSDFQLIILVLGLVEFFLFHLLADTKRINALFCKCQPSTFESQSESLQVKEKRGGESVSGGDVDVVLRSLGMFTTKHPESVNADELLELFEKEEASLEEVKEAFDVFDEDRDGFIDPEELQRVLAALGFKEGLKLENCRRMIAEFDQNGDGRIDFREFVTFMETSSTSQ